MIEARPSGEYTYEISIQTDPADPDCDPTQEECEMWLPGVYQIFTGFFNVFKIRVYYDLKIF